MHVEIRSTEDTQVVIDVTATVRFTVRKRKDAEIPDFAMGMAADLALVSIVNERAKTGKGKRLHRILPGVTQMDVEIVDEAHEDAG